MQNIHPSSIIENGAKIADDVTIGPFCHIGAGVELAQGVELKSHVVVAGQTSIGKNTKVFPFASLGHAPQDVKFKGEVTRLEIGENCTLREHVTMNPGTQGGGGLTKVGNNCFFLIGSHVAHDCKVGNGVIFSNSVMLAGHCEVGDFAIVGGGAGIHQFVRIGAHAFVGGLSGVENDVIPYGMALGNRAYLGGLNIIGLKRRGFERETIHTIRKVYRMLFANEGTLTERVEDVASTYAGQEQVDEILEFIKKGGDRSLCTPKNSSPTAEG